ncbi:MAG: sulfatase-like hydrolase/transferase [Candidatus Hydrogenedens sp.]|nr:sulfatase-like hydrolase/transferase [Candidatus Hydrogenedens sp.]
MMLVLAALSGLAAPESSAAETRPNILFAIADDASFPHMSAYGCTWVDTPGFDRVAREGLLFNRAYTSNAKCAPSRSCLLTGRNSWQLEAAANHVCFFPPRFKVYPEVLAEAGYHVGFTGKGWAPGIAEDADGQPRAMTGKAWQSRKLTPPTTGISGIDYAANFADFLEAQPEGAPFCFWYGGFEPHRAYEFDSGAKLGGKDPAQIEDVPDYWPDSDTIRRDMLDYAYEIEYFDRHLVRMLEQLESRGQLENTLVIVTADNGMPFPRIKGQAYPASNHLPLAMMWADGIAKPGRTIDTFVSFSDFAPTYLELAGVAWGAGGMAAPEGISLLPLLQAEAPLPHRDHMLIGKERHDIGRPHDWGYPVRGILNTEWLYLRNFEPTRWPAGNPETGYLNCDGSPTKTAILDMRRNGIDTRYWQENFGRRPAEELYDLARDPDCLRNLAEDADLAEMKARLKEQMTQELTAQEDPRILGKGEVFEAYPYANQGQRGFYEKYLNHESPPPTGWVNDSDYESEPVE